MDPSTRLDLHTEHGIRNMFQEFIASHFAAYSLKHTCQPKSKKKACFFDKKLQTNKAKNRRFQDKIKACFPDVNLVKHSVYIVFAEPSRCAYKALNVKNRRFQKVSIS